MYKPNIGNCWLYRFNVIFNTAKQKFSWFTKHWYHVLTDIFLLRVRMICWLTHLWLYFRDHVLTGTFLFILSWPCVDGYIFIILSWPCVVWYISNYNVCIFVTMFLYISYSELYKLSFLCGRILWFIWINTRVLFLCNFMLGVESTKLFLDTRSTFSSSF